MLYLEWVDILKLLVTRVLLPTTLLLAAVGLSVKDPKPLLSALSGEERALLLGEDSWCSSLRGFSGEDL